MTDSKIEWNIKNEVETKRQKIFELENDNNSFHLNFVLGVLATITLLSLGWTVMYRKKLPKVKSFKKV